MVGSSYQHQLNVLRCNVLYCVYYKKTVTKLITEIWEIIKEQCREAVRKLPDFN